MSNYYNYALVHVYGHISSKTQILSLHDLFKVTKEIVFLLLLMYLFY